MSTPGAADPIAATIEGTDCRCRARQRRAREHCGSGPFVLREAARRADAMKDRLRACISIAEVNATVLEIAPAVAVLASRDRIAAIDIRNLAAYRRLCITRDQP